VASAARYREAEIDPPDLAALALILIESMGAYREMKLLFGRVPGEIDDGRFVEAWVQTTLAVAALYGLDTGGDQAADKPAQCVITDGSPG
jgi:hypothetical protein